MLAGRYEIGRLIGRGGMAQVHIGYDTRLSRTVAVKVLRSDMATDPTFLGRFRREAQSVAALNHPAIVAVYDTGDEEIGTPSGTVTLPFIVMEYVNGRTVHDLLSSGDPIPIDEAAHITAGVLSALEYSHREGIIHRDIKPGNIMLTPEGQVKVMDFGIARAMADAQSSMTQTNTVVGTAQYLSPEQARGERVDARSDLYSTGCLLYEMLTGRPPFTGDSALAVAYQHVSEAPKPPSQLTGDVPEALDRVVMKSLAKDREDRYQDAAQFRSDLLAAARGQQVTAPATATYAVPAAVPPTAATVAAPAYAAPNPPTGEYRPPATGEYPVEPQRKSTAWLWAVIVLLIAALAFVGYRVFFDNEPEPEPTETTVMVTVPDLEGLDQRAATARLEELKLKPNIDEPVESDEIDAGLFVESDPPAGTEVEEGATVTLRFSSGVGEVEVPDVIGMTAQQARTTIEGADLVWGDATFVDNEPDSKKDEVVTSDPPAGTKVAKGTKINVQIFSGNIEVPNVVGLTVEEAIAELNRLSFSYRLETEETADYSEHTIIRQNYPEGTILAPGASIVITEAVAPPPEPSVEPTPPPEPSEEPSEEPSDDGDDS